VNSHATRCCKIYNWKRTELSWPLYDGGGRGAKPTKKLQACGNDCRVMPGGTPFPKVLGRGRLKTSSSARRLSPWCQRFKGDKTVHLHRDMQRISLSTWDSFAWIRIICRLRCCKVCGSICAECLSSHQSESWVQFNYLSIYFIWNPEGTQDMYSGLENVTQGLRRTFLFWRDIRRPYEIP